MKQPLRTNPAFLLYYASILDREVAARPNQNVAWMIAGAERARAAATGKPEQGELFA